MKMKFKGIYFLNIILVLGVALFLYQGFFLERGFTRGEAEYLNSLKEQALQDKIGNRSVIHYEIKYQYSNNKYLTALLDSKEVSSYTIYDDALQKIKEMAEQSNILLPEGFEDYIEIKVIETINEYIIEE